MYDKYQSPLSERYASKEMQYIFSPDMKFKIMDCPCGNGTGAGTEYNGRTDCRTERACRGY